MHKFLLILPVLLAACSTSPPTPKASFNSPLFAQPPEVRILPSGQYVVALFPKPNWPISVAGVKTVNENGRIVVFASKLKKAPAPSPQLFPLAIPPGIDPVIVKQALYWREPDDWNQPLPIAGVRPTGWADAADLPPSPPAPPATHP